MAFYARLRARQPSGKPGAIAVLRKLRVLGYSLWKNECAYDPHYHPAQVAEKRKRSSPDRAWRAALGISEAKFRPLAVLFEQAYQTDYEVDITTKQQRLKKEFAFSKTEDLLFYVLFCQKNSTIHDVRALIFNLPTATADYNFEKGMALLDNALLAFRPAQHFAGLTEFLAYFRHHAHLTIDVTEIAVQRPQDKARHKETYSGKKTAHLQIPAAKGGRRSYVVRQQTICRDR